jgi:hypothetical protein
MMAIGFNRSPARLINGNPIFPSRVFASIKYGWIGLDSSLIVPIRRKVAESYIGGDSLLKIMGLVCKALTEGEKLSALEYARWLTQKRWKGGERIG